jgi:hypothetical protein
MCSFYVKHTYTYTHATEQQCQYNNIHAKTESSNEQKIETAEREGYWTKQNLHD